MEAIGPNPFELTERSVHVWTVRNPASAIVAARFEQHLSRDERVRADRFRFDHLRHSFVVTRGALRFLIGRYLELPPATIVFRYGSNGKPYIDSDGGLEFNAAHSGDLAAFAFTGGCPIGVDLEQMRPLIDAEKMAKHFLRPEEAAELISLSLPERERAFFLSWARKEAFIKATGAGLSITLQDVCVTLKPNEPAALKHLAGDVEAAREWRLVDLASGPDHVATLAYCDRERPLTEFPITDAADLAFLGP